MGESVAGRTVIGGQTARCTSRLALIERPKRSTALIPYIVAQLAGVVLCAWLAHAMFHMTLLQFSTKVRTGPGQWISRVRRNGRPATCDSARRTVALLRWLRPTLARHEFCQSSSGRLAIHHLCPRMAVVRPAKQRKLSDGNG
uniref:Uncharacterized protein n=1 Tax=Cupriavidus pinatubonensis (strain JMP 134 / LMG 1197) TaxID=264198 RepID=Q46NN8_CUPPJ